METKIVTLNDSDKQNTKILFIFKIITIIMSVIILGLLVGIIVLAVKKSKEKIITKVINTNKEEDQLQQFFSYLTNKAGYIESWNELYGQNISNIDYSKNNKIENSFKTGGVNYNSDLGEINSGNDYEKNERNIYDLYILYSTEFNKDKHNGIILFIHGGS